MPEICQISQSIILVCNHGSFRIMYHLWSEFQKVGWTYEGNAIRKILDNIPLIQSEVPKELDDFIDVLHAMREIRMATYGKTLKYCSPRPNPYFSNVVLNFEKKWQILHLKYKISVPNKTHIISAHIPQYIEKKKIALGKTSDNLIEQTHQQTNKVFSRSNYFVKRLDSPAHKEKLGKGVQRYNSYNIWNILVLISLLVYLMACGSLWCAATCK